MMRNTASLLIERYRSELLMCALVAAMLASPVADRSPHFGGVLALIQLVLLLVGANYLANRKLLLRLAIPVAGIWLVARLLEAFGDSRHEYTHLAPIAGLALSCAILWALLRKFGTLSTVTSSVISEAVISYLVLAIAFSQLYWILDHFMSNAFSQPIPLGQSGTFLYFSMVTLSGLGYGSIFPMNPYVRLIASFENITGIFYLAVVVSRLVSSYHARVRLADAKLDKALAERTVSDSLEKKTREE
jgi:voltage-gated potassium channel